MRPSNPFDTCKAASTIRLLELEQNGFVQLHTPDVAIIRSELNAGLLAPQALTSPKYLYDALGSKLFAAICELPEYYPTRTETRILFEHLADIAFSTDKGMTLIDLGAGDCAKAERLFPALQPIHYVPVDISVDFLRNAVEELRHRFPEIRMTGIGMDFSNSLPLPELVGEEKRLFFYPGSSIGNFTPDEALHFLRRIRAACGKDGSLLIGVDLLKDIHLLNAAYDDALGLTAAFNLNVLLHLNRLLGANFNPRDWRHRSFFNEQESRVELHLEALRNVTVSWRDGERRFWQGQSIHTENCYKYSQENFLCLLERAGFGSATTWCDARNWFMVCHARLH